MFYIADAVRNGICKLRLLHISFSVPKVSPNFKSGSLSKVVQKGSKTDSDNSKYEGHVGGALAEHLPLQNK